MLYTTGLVLLLLRPLLWPSEAYPLYDPEPEPEPFMGPPEPPIGALEPLPGPPQPLPGPPQPLPEQPQPPVLPPVPQSLDPVELPGPMTKTFDELEEDGEVVEAETIGALLGEVLALM